MRTRDKLLALFESARGTYFSGEELAQDLGVSRAAVWKAVKALQSDGYPIDAVPNRGYCLSAGTDILSAQGIRKYLRENLPALTIEVLPEAVSTNALVREKAAEGAEEGYVLLANGQTQGRGRLGRAFFSPKDTGIYMSLLLRPEEARGEEATQLTTMAAVAMCEAMEAVSGERIGIKWVNDLFLREKKVCGILTEGAFDLEAGRLEYAVLGLGVNLYPPEDGFPEELADIAGALFPTRQSDGKNRLAAEFLNRFFAYYHRDAKENYIESYRARSIVIGREVTLLTQKGEEAVTVTAIDDRCRLHVRHADGSETVHSSGEIRIKMK